MEKILSLKVELWAVFLIVIAGLVAMIGFGFAALDGERGSKRFGKLSETALFLAEIPDTARDALKAQDRMEVFNSARFDDRLTGWDLTEAKPVGLPGYLLLSRFDGTLRRPVVELVSLADMQVRHSWQPDADRLLADFEGTSAFSETTNWTTPFYRAIHPVLLPDGNLVIKDHFAPLISIDACARRNWIVPGKVFHHSSEQDAEGNIWVASVVEPPTLAGLAEGFLEDELVQVSSKGKLLFSRSVPQILLDHGLEHLMFSNGRYDFDPVHLNDIQPALSDGRYWKKGDLFLSLRNISTLVQYRPSTDEIVWMQDGPWLSQHDVDILDDHRIAVFSNDAQDRGRPVPFVEDHSRIIVHDFATGTDSEIIRTTMARENVRTLFAGLDTALPQGAHLVEDVTNAVLFIAGKDGRILARYTNRAENGKIYQLGWSRYIDKNLGDAALEAMKGISCAD